jgi:excisionase family DNA binding protein
MIPLILDPDSYTLAAADVAERFGVDKKTPLRWARDGLITSIRTPGGRAMRFRESEVCALLQGGTP